MISRTNWTAFPSVNWPTVGAKCFCIYFYIFIVCILKNLLLWTHHLTLLFDIPWFLHWNNTINKMHLHGNRRYKAALRRLSRQVYSMTTNIRYWQKLGLVFLEGVTFWEIVGSLSSCSAQLASKSNTVVSLLGTLCCRALLVLVRGAQMQPVSMREMGLYPGVRKLQRELSYSWAVFQTLFHFFPTSLCNPCFKALKARDYSGNAETGWHIVVFVDNVSEDNEICIFFVPDSLIFSLYLNYNHWEESSDPHCWLWC